MATIAGSVKSLSTGVFNVKDENGNVRALKVGDEIYENDTVYGENGNTSSSQVEIQLSGNDVIVLNAGQKQLIDSSLIETAFGTEELFFTREALDLKADNYNSNADVVSDLRDAEFTSEKKESEQDGAFADANNADATKEETAEGEEEVEDETAGTGEFQARTGAATDINSDLRNAQFKARTQVFEDKSAFENESKDRLTSLTNTDRPSYTTPSVIQITPSTPPVQQVVTPPSAAPIIVIGNLSVNDITQYESEGFLIFTVTLDRPVASPVTFDYKTSPITASPNGKDYTDVFGKITIPAGSTSVTIKVPITDDYVSDNGETIKITITNVVGNATITKPEGIGTILDNPVNNPGNGTPNTPKEPGGYGEEDTVYAIIVGPGTVNEGNITTDYTVKLIDKDGNPVIVTKDTNVTVKYLNIDTEDNDTQYKNNDKITVTIKAGTSSNTFKVETKDDYISDNNEKYNLSIEKVNTNEFENVVIGDKTGNFKDVTTTIIDNTNGTPATPTTPLVPHNPYDIPNNPVENLDTITVRLFAIDPKTGARVPANEVFEGNNAEYIAVAFDKNGNEVLQGETVTVTFGKDGDTATAGGVDYVSTTQTVTIGTKFNTPTVDDYIADNGEKFSVQITDKTLSNASKYETIVIDTTSVTTTIIDDSKPNTPNNPNDGVEPNMESVTVKLVSTDINGNIIPEATIPEGATAYYKAILVDPSGNQIVGATGTVEITFKDGTAVRTGTSADGKNDFTATNQTVTLNTVFSAVANDDYIADNGETFNVQITDDTYSKASDYENVIHITTPIVTTIIDNSKPNGNTPHDPNVPNDHIVEGKDIVTIKLFAIDPTTGLVAKDASGNYLLANIADEGTSAKYIAYAFKDGTATFNDTTRDELPQVGKVNVTFNNASATGVTTTQTANDGSQDFDNLGQTVIIGESFGTKVFKDILTESGENYTVTITTGTYAPHTNGGYESVTIDTTAVTTTITDSATPSKVFVKIEAITDTIFESQNLKYKVTIVDESGNPVTVPTGKNIIVALDYSDNGANPAENNDYTKVTTVTIVGGTNNTEFELLTNDDYFAEGDEGLKITIGNITGDTTVFENIKSHTTTNGATSDKNTTTGTIKDNPTQDTVTPGTPNEPTTPGNTGYGTEDTVYVKITETPSTIEGGTLTHTVTLVDQFGVPVTVPNTHSVTVTLEYRAESSTGTGTFTEGDLSTIVKTVTIPAGQNHIDFTNITKDDFTSEGDEVYTVTIKSVTQSGAFENVAIADSTAPDAVKNLDSTTGTIIDGVILGVPTNARVDEDDFDMATNKTTITDTKSLNIVAPNGDNDYKLLFDGTPTFTSDNSSFNTTSSSILKSDGITIEYVVSENTTTAYSGAGRTDADRVFVITLEKNGVGGSDDNYNFTQFKNIDHPISGNNNSTDDDNIVLTFGYKITDGPVGNVQTSSVQNFTVTVNDSLPSGIAQNVALDEDGTKIIYISDESFAGGKITLNNGKDIINQEIAKDATIKIYDTTHTYEVGTLKNNGNGTLTFTPKEDYSGDTAGFSYQVSDGDGDRASANVGIKVNPIADKPTVAVTDVSTIEDDGNSKEGTHSIGLGLLVPTLSKDQTDQNAATAEDHPERNGYIELKFTNGLAVNGAILEKFDGTDIATISTDNQTIKIYITDKANYHYSGLNPVADGAIQLTEAEYKALKIQHAEDNDTDIKINIKATSYEVNDLGIPLNGGTIKAEDDKTMTVKINPATDDISLNWDTATGGTISQVDNTGTSGNNNVNNTFTFVTKLEGEYFTTPIDLKAILTKTSGTQTDVTPKGGDLDGSEIRTYTVSGIPVGTIITLGGQSAVANALGVATLEFNNANNKDVDPEFSMKLPEQYSGTVTGKITLSVQDKGVESDDTAGVIKTAEVYFNVVVTPVADIATIQVSQAVGFEDAGRDGGNTIDKDGTINTNGIGGIPLAIKVSSDDKDGSETFDVTISGIPAGAVIYYNNALVGEESAGTIKIVDFDNAKSLVIIPPHNSDTDFTLNVSALTKDGASVSAPTNTTIDVIVKNIADAPVGTDLKTGITVNEDNQLNLKDIYTTPASLAPYDDSEVLTVKIELPTEFTLHSGSPFYIENGLYVVKASDITAGNIKLVVPENFSGNADLKLTYVTTEKAGEGDSKTWDTQTVSIFVNPIADDVTVATSSTINEDADGSTNKIDLKPTLTDTDGSETVTSVKILASSVASGYELFLGSVNGTSIASKLVGLYYELTPAEADSVYAKNTIQHDADNIDNFDLIVVYTVKDTAIGTADITHDFTHTHTVNVQAVTDAPSIALGTITTVGGVTIDGTTVTVNTENSQFKVPVTTTSNDKDGSETVTKIVISGVPMGVEVVGGTYYGYSGSEHNGIWVVTPSGDPATKLDADGALSDIVFKVNAGANFDNREMTITTYTQDGVNAEVKSVSTTININKTYTPGTEPGTPAELELAVKTHAIQEDTEFSLASVLQVNLKSGGSQGNGGAVITITDIPVGSKVTGADYSYEKTIGGVTKTYYVVVGDGNAADMNAQLADIKITTPKDVNTLQVAPLQGSFTFTADIATNHDGGFNKGNQVTSTQDIAPVTDEMTVTVTTAGTLKEDAPVDLKITLTNPSDATKTLLVGDSITIKVTEAWTDTLSGVATEKGELWFNGSKITPNGDGTYTITKAGGFPIGTEITGLQYKPAANRDGDVKFEVSVKNQETGSSVTLDSTGDKTITVTPVVDVVLNADVVTATGKEDEAVTVGATTLANPVKLNITSGTFADGSEKIGNIILDEVPNGFTVWYKVGTELVMATNIGTTGGGTFDINPNIIGDAEVTRNKWLVPASADGSMPEVYINAPTNWSGDFGFKAKFSITEQNLSTATTTTVDVIGKITPVADGVTVSPTLTFGDAFSWIDLKLNANMKDVDGSEVMNLKITGLDASAQFKLANGTLFDGLTGNPKATYVGSKWELEGITYDQINNIQFAHDKSVTSVGVTASTTEVKTDGTQIGTPSAEVTGNFKLDIKDIAGDFKLDKGVSLDFDKIGAISSEVTALKGINKIDLTETGSNKLLNLSLQDVLDMSGSSKEIKITGLAEDKVSFKNETGKNWSTTSTILEGGKTFDIYTNSGDSSVKVKVEQAITDGITS